MKGRQYDGQKKKYKKTNNGQQNTTQKTKDWVKLTLIKKPGCKLKDTERGSSACSTSGTHRVTVKPYENRLIWNHVIYQYM
jgi:hypothetical protein